MVHQTTDNRQEHRFEVFADGQTAFLTYKRTPKALTLVHTEVPRALRGQGVGDALIEAALHVGRSAGLLIVAECPFARAYLRKHPASIAPGPTPQI